LEDILACVQKGCRAAAGNNEKIDETQMYLQAIGTSVDTPARSLLHTITDTREYLHKDFGLMIQG
jgi:hypothetical protein